MLIYQISVGALFSGKSIRLNSSNKQGDDLRWPFMRDHRMKRMDAYGLLGSVNGSMFHITQLLGQFHLQQIFEGDVKQIPNYWGTIYQPLTKHVITTHWGNSPLSTDGVSRHFGHQTADLEPHLGLKWVKWRFPGYPKNGWFITENPRKSSKILLKWMIWGYP